MNLTPERARVTLKVKFENSHGKTIKVINVGSEQEALDYIKKEKYERWD